jgi:sugar phosphate isomerase/epimerase
LQLGLFTPVFAKLSFDQLLEELKRYPQVKMLEIGTGEWPGQSHIDVDGLLANKSAAGEYRRRLKDAGLTISALSCHGNPIHPNVEIAQRGDATLRKTITLAEMLEVPVVITFSGCPGGGPDDKVPNWITAAWPPEFPEALAWQWEKKLIPYWQDAAGFARQSGIKIALEAHPNYCVYNPETALKLRAAVGTNLGINLDPSHFWWQGISIPQAIEDLGEAIFHFHAKDVALNPAGISKNGVLDTKSYTQMQQRSWLFRSVGCGHSELDWKQIVASLRMAGYDYVMSIEHEDALASIHEGLSMAISTLSRAILTEAPVEPWWV